MNIIIHYFFLDIISIIIIYLLRDDRMLLERNKGGFHQVSQRTSRHAPFILQRSAERKVV